MRHLRIKIKCKPETSAHDDALDELFGRGRLRLLLCGFANLFAVYIALARPYQLESMYDEIVGRMVCFRYFT